MTHESYAKARQTGREEGRDGGRIWDRPPCLAFRDDRIRNPAGVTVLIKRCRVMPARLAVEIR